MDEEIGGGVSVCFSPVFRLLCHEKRGVHYVTRLHHVVAMESGLFAAFAEVVTSK